jgi:hypothetical protein
VERTRSSRGARGEPCRLGAGGGSALGGRSRGHRWGGRDRARKRYRSARRPRRTPGRDDPRLRASASRPRARRGTARPPRASRRRRRRAVRGAGSGRERNQAYGGTCVREATAGSGRTGRTDVRSLENPARMGVSAASPLATVVDA